MIIDVMFESLYPAVYKAVFVELNGIDGLADSPSAAIKDLLKKAPKEVSSRVSDHTILHSYRMSIATKIAKSYISHVNHGYTDEQMAAAQIKSTPLGGRYEVVQVVIDISKQGSRWVHTVQVNFTNPKRPQIKLMRN